MPDLTSVLASIPGYGAYIAKKQMNEQAGTNELQQAGTLVGLQQKLQQQKIASEEHQRGEALRAAVAALPPEQRTRENILPLLMQHGNVKELVPLLKGKQDGAFSLPPEHTRYDATGNPLVTAPAKDKEAKVRQRYDGETVIQEELQADGTYKEIGRGPRFARSVAPVEQAKQEPLVPVKEPDGRVIYVPRSEATGREVGGRTTDINLGKQVQQLGRDLEKAALPPTIAVLKRAEAITPEIAAYVTGPMSALPDRAIPKEARDARQDVQRLFNITLKQRSGAAVTNQELDRLKQEFGSGIIKKPDQLIGAIGRMREIIENHYSSIAGGYGKDALDTYNANIEAVGGTPFEMRPKPGPGAPTQPGAPQQAGGGGWTPDKEQRYQELLKRRQGGT